MSYQEKIEVAEKMSQELGLAPRINPLDVIDAKNIQILDDICNETLPDMIAEDFYDQDWSVQCMNIVPLLFTILQQHKIPCELTYGEVKVANIPEFNTSLQGLKAEWEKGVSQDAIAIHVWITIGKDYIIDPTISSRIFKPFSAQHKNVIVSGKADHLLESQQLEYIPILLGAKYIERICDISLSYQV